MTERASEWEMWTDRPFGVKYPASKAIYDALTALEAERQPTSDEVTVRVTHRNGQGGVSENRVKISKTDLAAFRKHLTAQYPPTPTLTITEEK